VIRSQIREGFRRIGTVLSWTFALALSALIVLLAVQFQGGSWWFAAKWIAIIAPVASWCGSRVAYLCFWLIDGFFPQDSEIEPQNLEIEPRDTIEAARAALVKEAAAKHGPIFAAELAAMWSREQRYLIYPTWALAWLAADQAGDALFYLQWGSVADLKPHLPPGVTVGDVQALTPWYLLWPVRIVAGIGTFIVLACVFIVGNALYTEWRSRLGTRWEKL
jgi:hypothetical protein